VQNQAVDGRGVQARVDMTGHRMASQQLGGELSTQLPQDRADTAFQPPVEDFPPIIWYSHKLLPAHPSRRRQALPFMHRLRLPAQKGRCCDAGPTPLRMEGTPDRLRLLGSRGQTPRIMDRLGQQLRGWETVPNRIRG
jgi:hypothetical protein